MQTISHISFEPIGPGKTARTVTVNGTMYASVIELVMVMTDKTFDESILLIRKLHKSQLEILSEHCMDYTFPGRLVVVLLLLIIVCATNSQRRY
jgi:hypothetical protein